MLSTLVAASPARAAACANTPIGAIYSKWVELGGANGRLGCAQFPGERTTPDRIGRFTHFDGGSIYWTPNTGAHSVWGHIRDKWAQKGWERGLGYPVTDELPTPDGVGRFNHFSNHASIYWTPGTGAHNVQGQIRDRWQYHGWENGLGYPTSDEIPTATGAHSRFQRGGLVFTRGAGVTYGDTRENAIRIANAEVGNSESNGRCTKYGPCRTTAWCAMFVNWVWSRAGITPSPTTWVATEEAVWGRAKGLFRKVYPVPGDLAVYGEPGSGVGGHVGLVVAVNPDGTIVTVEGNWQGAVHRRTINPFTARAGERNVRISGFVSPPNA